MMLETLTIVAVSLLILLVVGHSIVAARFRRSVRQSMAQVAGARCRIYLDSGSLPATVLRLAARAGVLEHSTVRCVHLRQSAEMRMAPDKPWAPLVCEQVISIGQPGFVWVADQERAGFTIFRVLDAFVEERGLLEARLLGSIRVAKLSGPDADRSELMRYLAELAWAPDALLRNPELRWRSPDALERGGKENRVVEVEADSRGGVARVRLILNEEGDICEMQADDRGSLEDGVMVQRPWRGLFSDYRELGGRRIPTRGEVGYVHDDGYSPYWRGQVTDYWLE